MKLIVVLSMLTLFNLSAAETYSQMTRLTLSLQYVKVSDVLKEIENQSEFVFLYSPKLIDVDRKINIEAENEPVKGILNDIFGEKVQFAVYDRQIVLTPTEYSGMLSAIQQNKITGTVTDERGNPLPGVTVQVKGSSLGTLTDGTGKYLLNNVPRDATLTFSFVGLETLEMPVSGGDPIDVVLKESVVGLEEVVVIGYGTIKKSDLTGSVSSIAPRAFLSQPASSINSVLTGVAPGVSVRRSNGAPGESPIIRVRGANSLLGNNDPLIVVDGNYGGLPNMYDIESIEILKDASATAIYGSRGANGVILVKTKRGTAGKPTMQLYSDVSVQTIPKHYDLMEPYEFAEFNNRVGAYPFTDDQLAKIKAEGGTDWQDVIFRTGLSHNYKVVLSGGSKGVKYYVSPSYNKTIGTIENTESSGYGLSAKVDMELSDRVSVQLESNVGHSGNLNPGLAQGGSKTAIPVMGALTWSPTEPVYEADGTFHRLGIGVGTMMNPLLMTRLKNTNYGNSGSGVGNLKVKIIEGLEFDAKGLISFGTGGNRSFESKIYNGVNANASQSSYESKSWLVNAFLTYTKSLVGVHNFSVMAGFEEAKNNSQSFSAGANILPLESVEWFNLGLAAPNINVGSGYSNSAMRSYFGRVNYNFASRYYLTANFRSDGSSKFKADNQFSYFPSFSLAWRLSEEKFMKNQNIFQDVKFRGGWGITGSQAIGNYATYTTMGSRSFMWGSVTQAGYYARVGGNPDLKWESTKQVDLGVDLRTLNDRLSFSFDYYDKKTEDLLAPLSVPAYNGGDSEYGRVSVISNVGSVRNKGFEVNIGYDVITTAALSYNVSLNGAVNRNEVLSIGEQKMIYGATYAAGLTSGSPFVLIAGQPIGTIWGMKYLGIWQQNEKEEAAKFQQEPGDYKYQDLNENGSYDSGDNQVIGNTNPSFSWGLNNLLSYKNFDVNVLIEGVHGRDVLNWSYMVGNERIDFTQLYNLKTARNRWTPGNTGAEFAKIGNTNRLTPLSSQYMQDGSYIKLRNVSLSYRIPKSVISFASIRLSVSAQNIFTITRYKGYDPEISSTSSDSSSTGVSDANSGMDWFAYPNPKSYSFGIVLEY